MVRSPDTARQVEDDLVAVIEYASAIGVDRDRERAAHRKTQKLLTDTGRERDAYAAKLVPHNLLRP